MATEIGLFRRELALYKARLIPCDLKTTTRRHPVFPLHDRARLAVPTVPRHAPLPDTPIQHQRVPRGPDDSKAHVVIQRSLPIAEHVSRPRQPRDTHCHSTLPLTTERTSLSRRFRDACRHSICPGGSGTPAVTHHTQPTTECASLSWPSRGTRRHPKFTAGSTASRMPPAG